MKKKVAAAHPEWDEGDVYYQILDKDGYAEASLHARAWNVELFRSNLAKQYGEQGKTVQFITRDEYRAIIWPQRKAA